MTSRLIDARAEMRAEVDASLRGEAVRLPPTFIKAVDGPPPLARLVLGGQGGDVRTKLFLTFAMRATKAPHNLDGRTNEALGRLLGLPIDTAARRVATAMRWLEAQEFVALSRRTGESPHIELRTAVGGGAPWKQMDSNGAYVKIPLNFWAKGWVQVLSARAIGVYIALAELTSQQPEASMTGHRKKLYGYSADTWTRALPELQRAGLIKIRSEIDGSDRRMRRRRNVYQLTRNDLIGEAPTGAAEIKGLRDSSGLS